LFTRVHSVEGKYNGPAHLAEIIALLGPPPKKLIDQERDGRSRNWGLDIENAEGELCDRASTYYGGPFFDSEGKIQEKIKYRANKQFQVNSSIMTLFPAIFT